MYYSITFYPKLSAELSESIEVIRKDHDPTWRLIRPHVGICFPATSKLDRQLLIGHVENVLRNWNPFEIQLGGFHKSNDHWLFLTLQGGADAIKKLNHKLYTGYLEKYKKEPGKPGYNFIPHLGLGLFLKQDCRYDWRNPRESDFDRERYEKVLHLAQSMPLPESVLVERLNITAIPEVLTEWTTGRRPDLPGNAKMTIAGEFRLGNSVSRSDS